MNYHQQRDTLYKELARRSQGKFPKNSRTCPWTGRFTWSTETKSLSWNLGKWLLQLSHSKIHGLIMIYWFIIIILRFDEANVLVSVKFGLEYFLTLEISIRGPTTTVPTETTMARKNVITTSTTDAPDNNQETTVWCKVEKFDSFFMLDNKDVMYTVLNPFINNYHVRVFGWKFKCILLSWFFLSEVKVPIIRIWAETNRLRYLVI